MIRQAFKVKGNQVYYCAPSIDTGVAATATITVAGTWTTGSTGPVQFRVGGQVFEITTVAGDTATTVAARIVTVVTANKKLPVSAANSAGVVTLTWKSLGARGNNGILWKNDTYKASGMTFALAGGSSVASGGVRFTGGSGTEDWTTLLATMNPEQYFTIAAACVDATNLARVEAAVDDKCGPLERRFEQAVTGFTGTLAAGTSLAQTTLDDVRFQMLWMEEGETPAEEMAAWFGAVRNQREQSHPNVKYDGMACPFQPQEAESKRPIRATQVAALDVGLTCIKTQNNKTFITRAVTTRSLTDAGGTDDATIDVGQSRTTDRVNEEMGTLWSLHTDAEDTAAHHYLRNDPAVGQEAAIPSGVTYPRLWQSQAQQRMKQLEGLNWVTEVDANPTEVAMHPTSSTPRFVQYTPVIVMPQTHQLEGTLAQTRFTPT